MFNNKVENMIFETEAYQAVAAIDELLVGHDFFDGAITGIEECIKASAYSREPINCMLLGEGGMGKTSVAHKIVQSMKPEVIKENDMETRTVPAFYTSFRSATSLDALTSDMLKKLGDRRPESGKSEDKASRVLELLIRCKTRIIFIDELHDLEGFEKRNYAAMQKLLKWVKAITNGGGPITCLMGIESCHDLFEHDPEMARRFKRKFFLRSLMPGYEDHPGLLPSFLEDLYAEIEESTLLTSFPAVTDLSVLQVWAATRGNLDSLMTLVKDAALLAMRSNRTNIEISDYAEVWDSGVLDASSVFKLNPFLAAPSLLYAAIREKR